MLASNCLGWGLCSLISGVVMGLGLGLLLSPGCLRVGALARLVCVDLHLADTRTWDPHDGVGLPCGWGLCSPMGLFSELELGLCHFAAK